MSFEVRSYNIFLDDLKVANSLKINAKTIIEQLQFIHDSIMIFLFGRGFRR